MRGSFTTIELTKKTKSLNLKSLVALSTRLNYSKLWRNKSEQKIIFIRTKRSERAKRAHSVLREVEKMGYKNFFTHTRIG